jgi:isoamylase
MPTNGTALPGSRFPLGPTVQRQGVNFSIYSRDATRMSLLLFDHPADPNPARVIDLDPRIHRTYHYWHVFVAGVDHGQAYAWQADGLWAPERGLRFDPRNVLLDPYARGVVVPAGFRRGTPSGPATLQSVVIDTDRYDWEGDAPLQLPLGRTVIYEMHVRGFTHHPSSGVAAERRGTYRGLVDKIPVLQELGISAVELMPVFQFDAEDAPPGRTNYWGYSPISFFAPHVFYATQPDPIAAVDEFRDMVKELHRAGIEVILDVVYNHTAEGNEAGPTLCFKGLANDVYYLLDRDRSRYANYTGTGNTLNANHPVVRRMILDSLRYWAREMHVDGFRFDLASVLSRDERGHPQDNPPVLCDIETDPILAGTKLIAEAWDAAGLYQVGTFVGDSWKEWNGRFRDDVRSFVRAEEGTIPRLASRLLGSPDLYGHEEREPEQSINFVTSHDGFTLNDLVSFDRKHNEANGEGNRDGMDDNHSWNCGVEGPTDDPRIEGLRNRQVKNFHVINLLALGAPMILMGDEVRRSQGGNNNAYCQDNETSWLDWSLFERHAGLRRFVQHLIAARLRRPQATGFDGRSLNEFLRDARFEWHGVRLHAPDWSTPSRSLALTIGDPAAGPAMHAMLNAYWEPLEFELPPLDGGGEAPRQWKRWIDTSLDAPDDIVERNAAPIVAASVYRVLERSIVVLAAPDRG